MNENIKLEAELIETARQINELSTQQEPLLRRLKQLAEEYNRVQGRDVITGKNLCMTCVAIAGDEGRLVSAKVCTRALGAPMPSEQSPQHPYNPPPENQDAVREALDRMRSFLAVLQGAHGRDPGSQMLPTQIAETERKIAELEAQLPPGEAMSMAGNYRSMNYRPINQKEHFNG